MRQTGQQNHKYQKNPINAMHLNFSSSAREKLFESRFHNYHDSVDVKRHGLFVRGGREKKKTSVDSKGNL